MFRLSHYTLAFCALALAPLTMAACDKGGETAPEIVEVPVPVLSASAATAQAALTEPKRYSEEREHKGTTKVRVAELPVTYEAKPDTQVVTRLAQSLEVVRLVDVGLFSLVEYPEGTAKKLGWVSSAGLEDDGTDASIPSVAASPTQAAATSVVAASTATPAAQSSAAPATSTAPAAAASATSTAAAPASSASAAPAASAKVRRGRLGR